MNGITHRLHVAAWSELTVGVLASAGIVALATAAIAVLDTWVPILSLGALYVLAVLPIAILWGLVLAVPAAVVSTLAFNWFFLPPTHTLALSDGENWLALGVYVCVAVVTSELAVLARRRAVFAEQREKEAGVLATVATSLLRGEPLGDELDRIADRVASVLRVPHAQIRLAGDPRAVEGEPRALSVDGRVVGAVEILPATAPDEAVATRFLPALASLVAVAADRDVLQRNAMEAETLRRSDAAKTAILRAVSHDLRSPLTAIQAAASGLADPSLELDDDDRAELLETIELESARLGRLVADLLDLSRLQAGAARPQRELWAVEALVVLAEEEMSLGVPIEVSLPDELPAVEVDAAQVRRVLANVLENALRFSPSGSVVRVSERAVGDEVVVRVDDDGPGIPASDVDRIFEPFERGEGTDGHRGAGLGLAIARGFAEANGGRVWAEQPPAGAAIAIALPAAASREAA